MLDDYPLNKIEKLISVYSVLVSKLRKGLKPDPSDSKGCFWLAQLLLEAKGRRGGESKKTEYVKLSKKVEERRILMVNEVHKRRRNISYKGVSTTSLTDGGGDIEVIDLIGESHSDDDSSGGVAVTRNAIMRCAGDGEKDSEEVGDCVGTLIEEIYHAKVSLSGQTSLPDDIPSVTRSGRVFRGIPTSEPAIISKRKLLNSTDMNPKQQRGILELPAECYRNVGIQVTPEDFTSDHSVNNSMDPLTMGVSFLKSTDVLFRWKEMERSLHCAICRGFCDSPVSLPCKHTFCSLCIRRHLSLLSRTCPSCNQHAETSSITIEPLVSSMITNLLNIRKDIRAMIKQHGDKTVFPGSTNNEVRHRHINLRDASKKGGAPVGNISYPSFITLSAHKLRDIAKELAIPSSSLNSKDLKGDRDALIKLIKDRIFVLQSVQDGINMNQYEFNGVNEEQIGGTRYRNVENRLTEISTKGMETCYDERVVNGDASGYPICTTDNQCSYITREAVFTVYPPLGITEHNQAMIFDPGDKRGMAKIIEGGCITDPTKGTRPLIIRSKRLRVDEVPPYSKLEFVSGTPNFHGKIDTRVKRDNRIAVTPLGSGVDAKTDIDIFKSLRIRMTHEVRQHLSNLIHRKTE